MLDSRVAVGDDSASAGEARETRETALLLANQPCRAHKLLAETAFPLSSSACLTAGLYARNKDSL